MYEMHAEVLPGPPDGCLRWHAVRPTGAPVAVCGHLVGPSDHGLATADAGIGELCAACMDEIASGTA